MKLAKGFIIAMLGLFIMITLVSLLMPSKVMTARSVSIHASQPEIVAALTDLQQWKNWHPVFMQPASDMRISEPSAGKGATASWISSSKQNKLEIVQAQPDGLKLILSREGEKDMENIISIAPVKDSFSIQVEWKVMTKLKWYPWEKFSGIFVDKMTGPGYQAALDNLRDHLEMTRKP